MAGYMQVLLNSVLQYQFLWSGARLLGQGVGFGFDRFGSFRVKFGSIAWVCGGWGLW